MIVQLEHAPKIFAVHVLRILKYHKHLLPQDIFCRLTFTDRHFFVGRFKLKYDG